MTFWTALSVRNRWSPGILAVHAHDKARAIIRSDFERLTRDGCCELHYANQLDCGGERASPQPRKVLERRVALDSHSPTPLGFEDWAMTLARAPSQRNTWSVKEHTATTLARVYADALPTSIVLPSAAAVSIAAMTRCSATASSKLGAVRVPWRRSAAMRA